MKRFIGSLTAISASLAAGSAFAAQPEPWQTRFQPAATAVMEQVTWFEQYTLWFIIPISVFVLILLAIVIVRFRASVNPQPSRTSHNTLIEVIWTVGPVVVLLFIAVPSFQLLTAQYTPPEDPALTVKATGNQWNWDYEYQVEEPLSFNSAMLQENARQAAGKEDKAIYPRLLAVDNEVVVPVNSTVRVLVTATDVIHAFAMPAFGIKTDAVPGRVNEIWFKATKEGLYYGQCSELCGKDHAFMPIEVHAVSRAEFEQWVLAQGGTLPSAEAPATDEAAPAPAAAPTR